MNKYTALWIYQLNCLNINKYVIADAFILDGLDIELIDISNLYSGDN